MGWVVRRAGGQRWGGWLEELEDRGAAAVCRGLVCSAAHNRGRYVHTPTVPVH